MDIQEFIGFTHNLLPQAKMAEVEQQLMADGEADATLQASMANYVAQQDLADEMLGVETEINNFENNSVLEDRIAAGADSVIANNETETQNLTTMNIQFTTDEALQVQQLIAAFNESYNNEQSLDENLVQFYLNQRPGTFPEDALNIVAGLRKGVDTFNANLTRALSEEGFDYKAELQKATAELPLAQKYELYLNFLAALMTLNTNNLSAEQQAEIEDFQTIRGRLQATGEVTDEMLAEVEALIADQLENNTLCLGSINALRNIAGQLGEGDEAIEQAIRGSEADVRNKMATAMATYIAYENGNIASIRGTEQKPEDIALAAAVGIEETQVINDVQNGNTTVDKALHILKVIGGVALTIALGWIAGVLIAHVALFSCGFMIGLLGSTSTLACIAALAFGGFVGWKLIKGVSEGINALTSWAGRAFDLVVDTWRTTAWPALKRGLSNAWNWLTGLFTKKEVSVQEEQVDGTVQVAPAMA